MVHELKQLVGVNEMPPFGGINYASYGRVGIGFAMKEMFNLQIIQIDV